MARDVGGVKNALSRLITHVVTSRVIFPRTLPPPCFLGILHCIPLHPSHQPICRSRPASLFSTTLPPATSARFVPIAPFAQHGVPYQISHTSAHLTTTRRSLCPPKTSRPSGLRSTSVPYGALSYADYKPRWCVTMCPCIWHYRGSAPFLFSQTFTNTNAAV
jgi:hypothetical protein